MTVDITTPQIKCIKTLVRKLNVDGESMVLGFTDHRTKSVSEMRKAEAGRMIAELKKLDPTEKEAEKMRRKMIGMAYVAAGLSTRATSAQKKEVIGKLNGWCKQYGYGHKVLDGYTYEELPKLIAQFEKVMNSIFKTV